jgi:CheY-like chemotaxis protein
MEMGEQGKKIVIFDDDEDIISICTYLLEEDGWIVTSYTNSNDAVNKVRIAQPNVILMDNWIPDQGGIMATRALKNDTEFRDIPVIYFSANSDIQSLAQRAGADKYLAKPFDVEQLLQIVRQAAA